jgi:ferric-dicitrate binding protein FerR (iron transport regulator)
MSKKRDEGTDEYGPDDPRWEAVHRFLDGLSPLPERREVERWIADDLSVQRYVKAHKKVWSMISRRIGPHPVDPEDAWESIQDRIAEHDRHERFSLPGRGREHLRVMDGGISDDVTRRRLLLRRGIIAGTGVAAAALIAVTSYVTISQSRSQMVVRHELAVRPVIEYVAPRGAHPHEQRLPDGSSVILAPDSHLTYGVDQGGAHVLSLVGEASFSVVHRNDRIFVVRAAGLETRDLGTEFDIRAYPGLALRVAVRRGRVAVRRAGSETAVEAGQVAEVDSRMGVLAVSQAGPDAFAWIAGRLVFHNAPFGEVAAQLSRTYNVDIQHLDSGLAAYPVTLTVSGDTVDRALALLSVAMPGLRYERHGRDVRLFRR